MVLALLCGVIAASIGSSRGTGALRGLACGLVLGPLGLVIVAFEPVSKAKKLALREKSERQRSRQPLLPADFRLRLSLRQGRTEAG